MSGYDNKGVGSFDILGLHDEPTAAGVVFAATQLGLENATPSPQKYMLYGIILEIGIYD